MFTIKIHVYHSVNEMYKPGEKKRKKYNHQKPPCKQKNPQLNKLDAASTDTVPGIA